MYGFFFSSLFLETIRGTLNEMRCIFIIKKVVAGDFACIWGLEISGILNEHVHALHAEQSPESFDISLVL